LVEKKNRKKKEIKKKEREDKRRERKETQPTNRLSSVQIESRGRWHVFCFSEPTSKSYGKGDHIPD
jgi:hypothetical protein